MRILRKKLKAEFLGGSVILELKVGTSKNFP